MAKNYFECHITVESEHPLSVQSDVEVMKWKFSKIDGDPNLGGGVKCYATRQFSAERITQFDAIFAVKNIAETLRARGHNVVREKVELVIYDTRSDSVKPDAVV